MKFLSLALSVVAVSAIKVSQKDVNTLDVKYADDWTEEIRRMAQTEEPAKLTTENGWHQGPKEVGTA